MPKVVALRHYAPVSGSPKFCRRSILLRDRYRCQYCGDRLAPHALTFEEIVAPRRAPVLAYRRLHRRARAWP